MSLFKKLFRSNKPNGFKDEFWGSLEYESKADIYGKKQFSKNPKGKIKFYDVEVRIDLECDESGPNKVQKEFFIRLKDAFPQIVKYHLTPLLNKGIANWTDVDSVELNFDNDFVLNELFLPNCLTHPVQWKLVLYYPTMDQFISIHFSDFEPDKEIQFNN